MRTIIFSALMLLFLRGFSQGLIPDTAVNKIELSDSISVLSILGKDCWNFVFEDTDHIKIIALNKCSERLELIFHEGDYKYKFSEFRISQVKNNREPVKYKSLSLNESNFVSSKGVRLGISPKSVESKLGIKLERKQGKNGEIILFFRKEVDKNPIFKKYNAPVYYGKYIFRNDSLVEFSFGFEQP